MVTGPKTSAPHGPRSLRNLPQLLSHEGGNRYDLDLPDHIYQKIEAIDRVNRFERPDKRTRNYHGYKETEEQVSLPSPKQT